MELAVASPGARVHGVWFSPALYAPAVHPLLPDLSVDLLVEVRADGTCRCASVAPAALASWPSRTPGSAYVGVRLAPGTGMPLRRFSDAELSADAGALARCGTLEQMARWLEQRALQRTERNQMQDTWVQHAIVDLEAMPTAGVVPNVTEWAARLGVSTRTLHRGLIGELGLAPKHALQLQRARLALQLLERGAAPAAAAVQAGFADQPHLTRDLKLRFGKSPGTIVAKTDAWPKPSRRPRLAGAL